MNFALWANFRFGQSIFPIDVSLKVAWSKFISFFFCTVLNDRFAVYVYKKKKHQNSFDRQKKPYFNEKVMYRKFLKQT